MNKKRLLWGDIVSPQFIFQFVLFLAAVSTALTVNTSGHKTDRGNVRLMVESDVLSHVVLGYKLVTADLFWIRLLQEIDYKESKNPDKGWAFRMLDAITVLDPRFHMAYDMGGVVLSVLVGDVNGSNIIMKRAVENFPHDWSLSYRAGYHFLYEAHDCPTAAKMFENAVFNGAPKWVASLSARLYTVSGQAEIGKSVLTDALEKFKDDPQFRDRLKERYDEIEKFGQVDRTGDRASVKSLCGKPSP